MAKTARRAPRRTASRSAPVQVASIAAPPAATLPVIYQRPSVSLSRRVVSRLARARDSARAGYQRGRTYFSTRFRRRGQASVAARSSPIGRSRIAWYGVVLYFVAGAGSAFGVDYVMTRLGVKSAIARAAVPMAVGIGMIVWSRGAFSTPVGLVGTGMVIAAGVKLIVVEVSGRGTTLAPDQV